MTPTSVEQRPDPAADRRTLRAELLRERFGDSRTLPRERFEDRR